MKKIFQFLFGKSPQIFDQDGSVRHHLPKDKWDAWQNRYLQGDEFNWRNHGGMRAKDPNRTKPS